MTTYSRIALLLLLPLILTAGSGCVTVPTIDSDQSAEELFRFAQEAYSNTQYKVALFYYESIIERFGAERVMRISAAYEIAYIHFKTGNRQEAKVQFETLLAEYRVSPVGFPRWVYVLTNDIYDQITE